ncbi:hypothetical protein MUO14_22460 [Halobacillus shinanisalinarum]|uniref:Uncharacterized protein n=1 Tax=Halobacillus shinanisalinarum TaxID=2932258 RepID=A0ABY4GYX6_9BACI|nr:hypothetical protein [Halobacillus shinanisalinarum]UOQ93120.1 hypothetical protein MUO14_22460 [Halobacillus shinanisalinarum]
MDGKYLGYSIIIGAITFVLGLIVFLAIDSPSPYIAGIVVAFLVAEISFYHFFGKEKKKYKL